MKCRVGWGFAWTYASQTERAVAALPRSTAWKVCAWMLADKVLDEREREKASERKRESESERERVREREVAWAYASQTERAVAALPRIRSALIPTMCLCRGLRFEV